MLTFKSGKVKLILHLYSGNSVVTPANTPTVTIKNSDLGTYWTGTTFGSLTKLSMVYDSSLKYWYYNNSSITTTGYYEVLYEVNDSVYGIRVEEQFKIIEEDSVWAQALDTYADGTFGGELATKSDLLSSASISSTSAASGTIIYGTQVSGSYLSTSVVDGTYWLIDEHVTDGLTIEFQFNIPTGDKAGTVEVFGHYDGGGSTHYMELWIYNFRSSAWEQLHEKFMLNENVDTQHIHEFLEEHIDRTNSNLVKIRLVHNTGTYFNSHRLYLDKVDLRTLDTVTASEIAQAVWGSNISTNVNPDAGYIVSSIKSKTDNLPTDPADQSLVETAITNSTTSINNNIDSLHDLSSLDVTQAIWNTELSSYTTPKAGYIVSSIKDKTDNLPSDPADQSSVELAITSAVSTINSNSNSNLSDLTTSINSVADDVWDVDITLHNLSYTTGNQLQLIRKITTNKAVISNDGKTITIYDDDSVTPLHIYELNDTRSIRTPL